MRQNAKSPDTAYNTPVLRQRYAPSLPLASTGAVLLCKVAININTAQLAESRRLRWKPALHLDLARFHANVYTMQP